MNATASDLKSAYVQFTRGGVIIDGIIPNHRDFRSVEEGYWALREVAS